MIRPSITIITASFNGGMELNKTIESVRNQTEPGIQWVIVDGMSTDSSIQIFRQNEDVISVWTSEKDSGIYDAWNKGIRAATGEWIIFLGIGDYFQNNETIKNAVDKLIHVPKHINFAYGCIYLVSDNNEKIYCRDFDMNAWDLGLPMLPPHPAVFHRRSIFVEDVVFDTSYKIAADSKFILQYCNNSSFINIDMVITCMVVGGVSSTPRSWNAIKNEKLRIRRELSIDAPFWACRMQDIKIYLKPFLFKVFGNNITILLRFFGLN